MKPPTRKNLRKIRKGKWLKITTKVIGSKIFEFLPLLEEMIQFDILLLKWVVKNHQRNRHF